MVGKSTLLSLCFILTFFSCNEVISEKKASYSFYAVGHAYGNPIHFQYGIYPPLQNFFSFINEKENIAFGVFTGDVVPKPTGAYWDSASIDFATLKKPFYIAAGNHDRGEEFQKRFFLDSLFYFNEDAFLIINTDKWMVSTGQLNLIEKSLSAISSEHKLFIFSHELVWWSPENEFSDIEINYPPQYPGETNFWNEVFPVLVNSERDIFWISGDVGSKSECTPFVINKKENITFLANGVGGELKDNVLIFDISTNGELSINAIVFDKNGRPAEGVNLY